MKVLVALRGTANKGKSTAIRGAYELLRTRYPDAAIEEIFIGRDITVVMTIDGKKVGIESQGDPNSRLFSSLKSFVRMGCKVILCATRSRGATVDAVVGMSGTYKIQWQEKQGASSPSAQATSNALVSKHLAELVRAALNA